MKPEVGTTVHYTHEVVSSALSAVPMVKVLAVIIKVDKKTSAFVGYEREEDEYDVKLRVAYGNGYGELDKVPFAKGFKVGHWSWRFVSAGWLADELHEMWVAGREQDAMQAITEMSAMRAACMVGRMVDLMHRCTDARDRRCRIDHFLQTMEKRLA